MNQVNFSAGLFALGILATTGAPALAKDASILIMHGIPGRDVGETVDPALPVDVLVDGKICLLKNVTFGDIAGPYDLPAGSYKVAVLPANIIAPCSGKALLNDSFKVEDGGFYALIAKLSTTGKPVLDRFPINMSKVATGDQRFVVLHAAQAPAVQFSVQSGQNLFENATLALAKSGSSGGLTLANSQSFIAQISANGTTVGEPITVTGGNQSVFVIAALGSATTGSVGLFSKVLYGVH